MVGRMTSDPMLINSSTDDDSRSPDVVSNIVLLTSGLNVGGLPIIPVEFK